MKQHIKLVLFLVFFSIWSNGLGAVDASGINKVSTPEIKQSAKTLGEFVPNGWRLNYIVEGDFNQDGLKDAAMVIEEDFKYEMGDEKAPERILLILFKQKDNSYKLVKQSSKAILKANEGGIFGDPFYKGLFYKNGALGISFYGGSADRWGLTYIFRYQKGDWYLIGATIDETNTNTGKEVIRDYNLSTGKLLIKKGTEGGSFKSQWINRGRKKLLKIDDFNPWVEADKDF